MSSQALSFVITHGELAKALVEASSILTPPKVETYTYSNAVKSLDELNKEISEIIERSNPQNLAFFVDLMGGSCWMLVNRLKRTYPQSRLLTGINLPMLVSFQINYGNYEWNELMEKIVEDAKKGIIGR